MRTDHDAFGWILNMADETVELYRWLLRLQELSFDVVNRAGIKNQAADALSKLWITGEDQTELNDELPVLIIEEDTTPKATAMVCDKCDGLRDVTPAPQFRRS